MTKRKQAHFKRREFAGLLFPHDPHIVAIATDTKVATRLPVFDLGDIAGIAEFVLANAKRIAGPHLHIVYAAVPPNAA